MCSALLPLFAKRSYLWPPSLSLSLFSPLFVRGLFSLSLRVVTDEEEEDILFFLPLASVGLRVFPLPRSFCRGCPPVCTHSASNAAAAYTPDRRLRRRREDTISASLPSPPPPQGDWLRLSRKRGGGRKADMRILLLRYNTILAPVQFPSPRSVSPSHRCVYKESKEGGGVSGAAELQARPLKSLKATRRGSLFARRCSIFLILPFLSLHIASYK